MSSSEQYKLGDWCDQEGARILGYRIQEFWWKERRKRVAIKIVPSYALKTSVNSHASVIYQVRSDMLHGYPR